MRYDPVFRRLVPDAGPEFFQSFTARAPIASHWRPATCAEYECEDFLYGFVLTVDMSTELGQKQYHYVTKVDKSRKASMQRLNENIVKFVYGPGFDCFEPKRSTHRVPVGRPPYYLVADGDFRGNPRGTPVKVHRCVEDWVDDFANTTAKQAEILKRG